MASGQKPRIGIIGAGNLARRFAALGHEVAVATSYPGS
jgi:predicted dinucleotide-binding enzyme